MAPESHTPPLGITMGCPAAVGPEIILKVFTADPHLHAVVVGDLGVLAATAQRLALSIPLVPWQPGSPLAAGAVNVCTPTAPLDTVEPGRPTPASGRAMRAWIETAADLALAGALAGVVTCPISKEVLHRAGCAMPGHTELLAHRCGVSRYAMMMAAPDLKVVLATIHVALAQVPRLLAEIDLLALLRLVCESMQRDFAVARPRLAVAGLNPHAGEAGMFGDQEARYIAPAVAAAREAGMEVSGPWPPDTVFHRAAQGDFDAVLAMYHDQGLIPFKLLHFHDGVNVTLGLPIVRTSVDHGTAYDIAGKGIADHRSLAAACRLAATISANRREAGHA